MESGVDCRYYTSIAKPTVASHAEDVARQAVDPRAADDEEEYNPQDNASTSCTLCITTKRGTLVEFFDEFEPQSEMHASHRDLLSTERLAQIKYEQNVRPLIVK